MEFIEILQQCCFAFLACVGFSIVFDVKKPLFVFLSSLIGALGWAVFLLVGTIGSGSDVPCYLVATITVSVLAEICARVLKAPATIFLLIGIIPLVPGGGLYYAMNFLINGNYAMFAKKGIQTAAYAGAIAVGVSMVTSIVRMISWKRFRQHFQPTPKK